MMRRLIIFQVLLILSFFDTQAQDFFAKGNWFKFSVSKAGIYEISQDQLQVLGIDVSNPEAIHIFGGNGYDLSQIVSDSYKKNPEEVPTKVVNRNGKFFLQFLSLGPYQHEIDEFGKVTAKMNSFSSKVNYYLKLDASLPSNKIASKVSTPFSFDASLNKLISYQRIEKDSINILESGRAWYFNKMIPGQKSGFMIQSNDAMGSIDVKVKSVALSYKSESELFFYVNKDSIASDIISSSSSYYGIKGRESNIEFQVDGNIPELNLEMEFLIDSEPGARAYIDFIEAQYDISKYDENKIYYSNGVAHLNSKELWVYSMTTKNVQIVISDSESDKIELVDDNQLVIFPPNQGQSVTLEFFQNFDLTVIDPKTEMIIIYDSKFKNQAQDYQKFKNGLSINTHIADIQHVKDHFGDGIKDISVIRNYIFYQYNTLSKLKSVMLIGDCSYDLRDESGKNSIPIYQSRESLNDVQTFSSDDFYGFMSVGDGYWDEESDNNHTMNVAIGRIPAENADELEETLTKLKNYQSNTKLNYWDKEIIFVSDDGDDGLHTEQSNELAKKIVDNQNFMHTNRLYVDAFKRDNKKVSFNEYLVDRINEGSFIVNFTGHGSERGWTSDGVLGLPDINSLQNELSPSIFITATCEFGRYDDPSIKSGGEQLLLQKAGALALVTATRPAYASTNFKFNDTWLKELFILDTNGDYGTFGDVFMRTKNNAQSGIFNRNFSFLGDPSMRFKFPKNQIGITEINGKIHGEKLDSIRPGQFLKIKGAVYTESTEIDTSFNGYVTIELFDGSVIKETRGYNNQTKVSYNTDESKISMINVSVKRGLFVAELATPVGFSYVQETGKIVLIANSDNERTAMGYFNSIFFGGEPMISSNDSAPTIVVSQLKELDISDTIFQLRITMKDDIGIEINPDFLGRQSKLYVNNDLNNPIILNSRMIIKDSSSKEVYVDIDFKDLDVGETKLDIETYDVHGNSATLKYEIKINSENDVYLSNNIVREDDFLNFVVKDADLSEEIQFELKVLNLSGEILFNEFYVKKTGEKSKEVVLLPEEFSIYQNGIYFYNILLKYNKKGAERVIKGRIVKI